MSNVIYTAGFNHKTLILKLNPAFNSENAPTFFRVKYLL